MANRPACAACRHQRKKCMRDCILAPYFPKNKLQEYEEVHRVFGYNNVTKMVQNLGEQERQNAINSIKWEAKMWTQDPIFGPFGAYNDACKTIAHIWNLLQQQQEQAHQRVSTSEPDKFMGQAQVSLPSSNEALPISNNINWAHFDSSYVASNNVVHNPNFEYQQVNYLGGSLQNEEPNVLKCVPSGIVQPSQFNYLQSVASSSGTNVTMDQYFHYSDENIVTNEEMGMQRDGQGNYGIHTMAQNRVRSQITEIQHLIHHPFGHSKIFSYFCMLLKINTPSIWLKKNAPD
ncbi:protein LATERAL ORGAN BOUNDARIES [Trifolium repens]|nr:protein LATERAL ORGAN BOUNDARIES [Trifolium repens]